MLSDAEMTDVRRYCGYQLTGTTMAITDEQDLVYTWFGMVAMSLHKRLSSLSASEETVLRTTYLTNLSALESAIPTAGANLDTDEAAVWKHNKMEVSDRSALFDGWRIRMCEFIGIAPGPLLRQKGGVSIARG
jgi:hypothetical protein